MRITNWLVTFTWLYVVIYVTTLKNYAPYREEPSPYPKNYFRLPVDAQNLRLSGTFGELRPNHFHTGIDLSGNIGQPIYAAAEGYVYRIRVQEGGYGNALYIRHPNGYTTVYAHLHRFKPEIARYVKAEQYRRESFEVDLYPGERAFPIKKGEQIGLMGNSGSSEGPHLHFEIRRTKDQKLFNPLLFNLPIADKDAPELLALKIYYLNDRRETIADQILSVERRPNGNYGLKGGDTLMLPAWRVGFALQAFDRATGNTFNKNGLFSLRLFADEQQIFGWRAQELDFDETRYINAHIDYAEYKRSGMWFQRCYLLAGDRLSMYEYTSNFGVVPLYQNRLTFVSLLAADAYGNPAVLRFWVRRGDVQPIVFSPHQRQLSWETSHRIEIDGFALHIPASALYETLYFQYMVSPPLRGGLTPTHHVHNDNTPLHRYCTLSLRPIVEIPPLLTSKALILYLEGKRPESVGGRWVNGAVETRIRELGRYAVFVDTVAPTIQPVAFSANMRGKAFMAFAISDNFSTKDSARPLRYRATVDGKWILFEFDRKNGLLTHHFDEGIAPGKHSLRLVVIDDRDNVAVFEQSFVR
ncbi:MAG: M23 family metallopeptidase [Saprospiraceae bacterium]|nr:M23 family metallopeptidase [Saprospiraceae bacterium]MDW8483782.1 M23 family metallopeptidase [Saprospiraceae bacterium]